METTDFTTNDGRGQLQKLRRLLAKSVTESKGHETKSQWMVDLLNNATAHVSAGNAGETLSIPLNNNSNNTTPYIVNTLKKAVSEASLYQGDYVTQMIQDFTDSLEMLDAVIIPPATLWVNPATGDDSNTRAEVLAGGGTVQWATLGRAVWGSTNHTAQVPSEAATAGDVVSVAAGTYDYAGALGAGVLDMLYNPANSGTPTDQLVFRAEGTVNLTHSGTGNLRSVFGALREAGVTRSYVTWTGPFTVNTLGFTWVGDRGPFAFWGELGDEATGCIVDGAVLHGHTRALNDNWSGVRLEHADGCTVKNTNTHNFVDNNFGWGIIMYDSPNCIVENNYVAGTDGGGIYIKGAQNNIVNINTTVRKNHVDSCDIGIEAWYADNSNIYQNLVTNCVHGVGLRTHLAGTNSGAGAANVIVANNVFYNTSRSFVFFRYGTGTTADFNGIVVANNIGHTSTGVQGFAIENFDGGIAAGEFTSLAEIEFKHNLWFGETGNFADFVQNTFELWRDTTGQDNNVRVTLRSDPLFTTLGTDFTLQGASPAINAGLDILDLNGGGVSADINMGCYVLANQSDLIGTTIVAP